MFTSFDAASGAGSGADEFASAASPSPFVGRIETVAGACTLSSGDDTAITLKVGDAVRQNDIIATAPDGRASIRFIDGTSFTVSDDARVVVKEFVCGGASPSARFDVVSGTFAFIAGDIAKAGKFEIDTAVASIRGRARTGGIGMLTLTALMFAIMEEARADSPGQAFLDDGTITYNGVFEVITKEAVPKHYVVDNPAESLVLQRIGSSVNADQMINSAQIMDQLHAAQQEALHIFSLGLAQGPTTTGPGGSGDPPLSGPPTFFQPINFTPPPGGGPPTGPSGPPNPGPPPVPPPLFLDVVFTPPPAAPGKINEITGHTGDAAPDTTSSSLGLFNGPATVGTPTFAWSGGPLTSGDQTNLAAASTLTLSDSGGFITYQYSAEDKTFDFLAATETLTVTYNVTAGGITQQAVITITGTNDTPMITSAAQIGTITEETNLHQPNPTGSSDLDKASGTVTFTDADLTDHHQIAVTGVAASGVTTGLADQATVLGWLTLGPLSDSTGGVTGSDVWTFSAQDKNFDYLAAGETLTLTYTVKVDDGNGGAATQDVTVTITGTNDTPVITSAAQIGTITEETNLHQPNPTGSSDLDKASGTVTFTDADLSDHHQVTVTGVAASGVTTGLADQATVLGWLTLGALSDSTGGVTGSDAWTFSAQDKNFDYLAAGETLTLTYTIKVDDGNGGTATQDVAVTITGTNDTPVIISAAQTGTIAEETNPHQPNPTGSSDLDKASGTVTFTDADLSDHHQVTVTGVAASGVTTGLADQATVLGWLTLGALSDSTGGVTGSDVWTFSAQDKNFDYLAAGETLTLTYTIKVDDGHGGTATQDVAVTITGTNDTPVINLVDHDSASATLTESYKMLAASGTLTVTDVDLSDAVKATITGVTLGGTTGGLTSANVLDMLSVTSGAIAADPTDTHNLVWSFNSNPQTFSFLDAGESLTLTYNVQVNDGHGGIANQAVTITVNGTDQPDLVTSFTGIDSHGYFGEHALAVEHVSDGGADVTSQASFQWQVLLPWFLGGQWITVSNSNSFGQVELFEGLQLRVTANYTEADGTTDKITTYLGQISDNDSDDHGASVRIQNLPNSLQVADGAALELAAATALAVFFPTSADAYGKLVIDDAGSFTGQIHNFAGTSTQSDAIDLRDITYSSNLSLSYHDNSGHDTGGTLSLLQSGHVIDTIKFADGDYSVDNFALASDGHGGTIISDPPSPATGDATIALTAGADTLALSGEAHSVTGTAQTVNNGDTVSGSGADTLTIDSGNGDQSFTFGDGHHSDVGMTGIETLTLTDSAATSGHAIDVTFDSSFHNNGTLTVDGSALSHLDGANLTVDAHLVTADAFVFVGSSGADTLIGGAKADTIIGGSGGDTLTGGGGGDTFVFKAITDSQPGAGHFDVITDFTHNADHLDFSAIDGLNSSVQAVNFVAGTSAPGSLAAHTIDIVTSGADTVVYANASGSAETAGHVDMEIHLHNVTNVQSSDFILHG